MVAVAATSYQTNKRIAAAAPTYKTAEQIIREDNSSKQLNKEQQISKEVKEPIVEVKVKEPKKVVAKKAPAKKGKSKKTATKK